MLLFGRSLNADWLLPISFDAILKDEQIYMEELCGVFSSVQNEVLMRLAKAGES